MPSSDQVTIQTYAFNCPAGGGSVPVSVANNKRMYLLIQNNGTNPLNVRFGQPNQGGASDYEILAGDEKEWDQKIPIDSVNLSSALGTFGVILEGRAVT